jgi:hypothetical protein
VALSVKGLLTLAALAIAAAYPSVATGATCGQSGDGDRVLRGTLTLNAEASQTTQRFGTSERTRKLIFDYDVGGCQIANDAAVPRVEVLPHGANQLPDEAVEVLPPVLESESLRVNVRIDPSRFDPEKYDLAVRIAAPYLTRQTTPGYVSRSDAAFWKPLTAALAGGLAAFFLGVAGIASKTTGGFRIRSFWFAIGLIATVVAGLWVLFSDYWTRDVEVWKWPDDWAKTAVDAVAAGSVGAITGLIAKVVSPGRTS